MTTRCSLGILFTILFTGCATIPPQAVNLFYWTEPAGGTIFDRDGNRVGRCGPHDFVMMKYELSDVDRLNGSKQVPPVIVKWVSGACTTTETVNVSLMARTKWGSDGKEITVMRPSDAPNAQVDATYGAQLEQNDEIRDAGVRASNAAEKAAKTPRTIFVY